MGYVLLWIENLAVWLLLMALVFACVGRLRRRWLRYALWMSAALLLLLPSAFFAFAHWDTPLRHQPWAVKWSSTSLALAISFVVGTLWLRMRGLRRVEDMPAPTVAGNWPRGKLTVALLAVIILHLMTYWNLDLAARQQLAALRVEAGALAESVAPQRVPDRDNAAFLYEQAFKAIRSRDDRHFPELTKNLDSRLRHGELPSPELQKVVHECRGGIALLNEAATKPGCYFEHDYHWPVFTIMLPEIQAMRTMANFLVLDAQMKAAEGDGRGAILDMNTVMVMARHANTEPFVVPGLVSVGLEGLTGAALQGLIKTRKVSTDDLAELRVEDSPSHQSLFERAVRLEEASRLTIFCEFGAGELGIGKLNSWTNIHLFDASPPKDRPMLDFIVASLYRVFWFADDLAGHRRLSQRIRELAAKPYCVAKPMWQDFGKQCNHDSGGILTQMFLPAMESAAQNPALGDAQRNAVRLGVAAFRYSAKNGRFPEKLEELAPDFIPFVPTDPFDGKLMKMKRTDGGLVVYSIGPDMVDNGGAPFDYDKRTGDIIFELPPLQP